jgi:hypothetical protein
MKPKVSANVLLIILYVWICYYVGIVVGKTETEPYTVVLMGVVLSAVMVLLFRSTIEE